MASSRALRGAAHINNNRSRDARKTGPACAERQPARSREPRDSLRLCHGAREGARMSTVGLPDSGIQRACECFSSSAERMDCSRRSRSCTRM